MKKDTDNNIIHLDDFRKEPAGTSDEPIIVRISSELDGMEALYSSDLSTEHLFSIKILFWALLENGQVCAVIPWLKTTATTDNLKEEHGKWHGYYDVSLDRILFKAPEHKIKELQLGHHFFKDDKETKLTDEPENTITKKKGTPYLVETSSDQEESSTQQELPDHLGTHAAFKRQSDKGFYLKPVISWRLTANGDLLAMVPEEEAPNITPLPGSEELMVANDHPEFRYYFQHSIASRIKHQDPDAMTAVSLLIDLV